MITDLVVALVNATNSELDDIKKLRYGLIIISIEAKTNFYFTI